MTMTDDTASTGAHTVTHPIIAAIDPHRPDDAPLALAARLRPSGAPVIAAGVIADDGIASAVPTPEWQRIALEQTQEMLDDVARVDAGVPWRPTRWSPPPPPAPARARDQD